MPSSQSDRNGLFGVLALQMEFITQAGLIAALQAWTLQKTKPLGELLVELGHMSAEDRAALEPMVDRHVARHGGSAEQSLAALSSVSEVAAELRELSDADVQQSLGHIAASESRQAGALSGVLAPQETNDEAANAEPVATLEMNAVDATARNLHEGESVDVFNQLGRIRLTATITDKVPAGTVAVPFGRWGTDPDAGGANSLTSDALGDLASGPTFCDNLVEVCGAPVG